MNHDSIKKKFKLYSNDQLTSDICIIEDCFDNVVKVEIPDMVAVYAEEDSFTENSSCRIDVPLSTICQLRGDNGSEMTGNNPTELPSDSDISVMACCPNSSCRCTPNSETSSLKITEFMRNHISSDRNSLYGLCHECPLSSSDCIRKSILYADEAAEITKNLRKMSIIESASTSSSTSDIGYPVEESSCNDGTYSVVEELPSDHDDKICSLIEDLVTTDDDLCKDMEMYSDSLNDSVSSKCLRTDKNHREIYEYLKKCLTATDNIRQSISHVNEPITRRKYCQDVVGKIIDNYHNVYVEHPFVRNLATSAGRNGSSDGDEFVSPSTNHTTLQLDTKDCAHLFDLDELRSKHASSHPYFNNFTLQSKNSNISEISPRLQRDSCVYTTDSLGTMPFDKFLIPIPDEKSNEIDLADIILEPPDMFKTTGKKGDSIRDASPCGHVIMEFSSKDDAAISATSLKDSVYFNMTYPTASAAYSNKLCLSNQLTYYECTSLISNRKLQNEIPENLDNKLSSCLKQALTTSDSDQYSTATIKFIENDFTVLKQNICSKSAADLVNHQCELLPPFTECPAKLNVVELDFGLPALTKNYYDHNTNEEIELPNVMPINEEKELYVQFSLVDITNVEKQNSLEENPNSTDSTFGNISTFTESFTEPACNNEGTYFSNTYSIKNSSLNQDPATEEDTLHSEQIFGESDTNASSEYFATNILGSKTAAITESRPNCEYIISDDLENQTTPTITDILADKYSLLDSTDENIYFLNDIGIAPTKRDFEFEKLIPLCTSDSSDRPENKINVLENLTGTIIGIENISNSYPDKFSFSILKIKTDDPNPLPSSRIAEEFKRGRLSATLNEAKNKNATKSVCRDGNIFTDAVIQTEISHLSFSKMLVRDEVKSVGEYRTGIGEIESAFSTKNLSPYWNKSYSTDMPCDVSMENNTDGFKLMSLERLKSVSKIEISKTDSLMAEHNLNTVKPKCNIECNFNLDPIEEVDENRDEIKFLSDKVVRLVAASPEVEVAPASKLLESCNSQNAQIVIENKHTKDYLTDLSSEQKLHVGINRAFPNEKPNSLSDQLEDIFYKGENLTKNTFGSPKYFKEQVQKTFSSLPILYFYGENEQNKISKIKGTKGEPESSFICVSMKSRGTASPDDYLVKGIPIEGEFDIAITAPQIFSTLCFISDAKLFIDAEEYQENVGSENLSLLTRQYQPDELLRENCVIFSTDPRLLKQWITGMGDSISKYFNLRNSLIEKYSFHSEGEIAKAVSLLNLLNNTKCVNYLISQLEDDAEALSVRMICDRFDIHSSAFGKITASSNLKTKNIGIHYSKEGPLYLKFASIKYTQIKEGLLEGKGATLIQKIDDQKQNLKGGKNKGDSKCSNLLRRVFRKEKKFIESILPPITISPCISVDNSSCILPSSALLLDIANEFDAKNLVYNQVANNWAEEIDSGIEVDIIYMPAGQKAHDEKCISPKAINHSIISSGSPNSIFISDAPTVDISYIDIRTCSLFSSGKNEMKLVPTEYIQRSRITIVNKLPQIIFDGSNTGVEVAAFLDKTTDLGNLEDHCSKLCLFDSIAKKGLSLNTKYYLPSLGEWTVIDETKSTIPVEGNTGTFLRANMWPVDIEENYFSRTETDNTGLKIPAIASIYEKESIHVTESVTKSVIPFLDYVVTTGAKLPTLQDATDANSNGFGNSKIVVNKEMQTKENMSGKSNSNKQDFVENFVQNSDRRKENLWSKDEECQIIEDATAAMIDSSTQEMTDRVIRQKARNHSSMDSSWEEVEGSGTTDTKQEKSSMCVLNDLAHIVNVTESGAMVEQGNDDDVIVRTESSSMECAAMKSLVSYHSAASSFHGNFSMQQGNNTPSCRWCSHRRELRQRPRRKRQLRVWQQKWQLQRLWRRHRGCILPTLSAVSFAFGIMQCLHSLKCDLTGYDGLVSLPQLSCSFLKAVFKTYNATSNLSYNIASVLRATTQFNSDYDSHFSSSFGTCTSFHFPHSNSSHSNCKGDKDDGESSGNTNVELLPKLREESSLLVREQLCVPQDPGYGTSCGFDNSTIKSIECGNGGDGGDTDHIHSSVSVHGGNSSGDFVALCVSNLEAIRKFSNYFTKSLETDSQLREGIPDLSLDIELGTCPVVDALDAHQVGEVDRIWCPTDKVDSNNNNNKNTNTGWNRDDNNNNNNSESKHDISGGNCGKDCGTNDTPKESDDEEDQVTSFVSSSSDSALSEEEGEDKITFKMENKKKNWSVSGVAAKKASLTDDKSQLQGILKSALKRGSKKYSCKKNRVQFNESLNKFFKADYEILVRGNGYNDDEFEDIEYGQCECGSQFCYDSYYYEDVEVEVDEDCRAKYCYHSSSVDSLPFDFAAAFNPPMEYIDPVALSPPDGYEDVGCSIVSVPVVLPNKVSASMMTSGNIEDLRKYAFDPPVEFVDPVTLSPPDGYKDAGCGTDSAPATVPNKVSASTMTSNDSEGPRKDGTRPESRAKSRNENNLSVNEKPKIVHQQQQQLRQQQEEHIDDAVIAKKDQRNQGYAYHRPSEVSASGQVALFNDANLAVGGGGGGGQSRYIVETITMTTVTERRIVHESNDQMTVNDVLPPDGSKFNGGGILKGGKLWRNTESGSAVDCKAVLDEEAIGLVASGVGACCDADDDKRSVKFVHEDPSSEDSGCDKSENYEKGEFTLTFKLGNRVVPCNSLKPNSAVRQLFPDPRFASPAPAASQQGAPVDCEDNLGKCEGKYLVTEESLRAFNEVNRRSVFATFGGKERYPYKDANFTVHSDDEDIPQNDLIKKTIERNTLRRSLMRYPRGAGGENRKRGKKKAEPSLEERIKRLTCDIDDEQSAAGNLGQENADASAISDYAEMPPRSSPPGEESHHRHETAVTCSLAAATTSSSSSCAKSEKSSAYKKFTDLFRNKSDNQPNTAIEQQAYPYYQPVYHAAQPDLGIDMKIHGGALIMAKKPANTNEARKQFLSSLAPLTACVTGHVDPHYGNRETLKLKLAGDRSSIISAASTGTEYSIGDIDEALMGKPAGDEKAPQPDVVAGTPNADPGQDELAMFVQQDAGRIERIKKRYSSAASASAVSDDDEHDDYGFSRRPSVRSIKPRFGSTTEILQQMQAHLQPPLLACPTKAGSHMTWPYYSAECADAAKNGATSPRNPLPALKEESNATTTATAEYTAKLVWEKSASALPPRVAAIPQQGPLKIDASAACGNVHMFRLTPADSLAEMTLPPYGKGDGCGDPRRLAGAGGGNIFQMKVSPVGGGTGAACGQARLPINAADGAQFAAAHPIQVGTTSVIRVGHGQQQTFRVPCPVGGPVQVHLLATHHHHHYESPPPQIRCAASSQPALHAHAVHPPIAYPASAMPLAHHPPQQIVLAKGTQTSTISSTTSFYQLQTNSQVGAAYPSAVAATNAVAGGGEPTKLIQLNYAVAHQSTAAAPIAALTSSPTRLKSQNQLTERGIPEGAVSSTTAGGQDCVKPTPHLAAADVTSGLQSKAAASVIYGMKV